MIKSSDKSTPARHTRSLKHSVPELRRQQIPDEATRIIARNGYFGFSIQEVATCCGLTTAELLYYFKTKEDPLAPAAIGRGLPSR